MQFQKREVGPQKVKLPEQGAGAHCGLQTAVSRSEAHAPLVTRRSTCHMPGPDGTQRGEEYTIQTHLSWQNAHAQLGEG